MRFSLLFWISATLATTATASSVPHTHYGFDEDDDEFQQCLDNAEPPAATTNLRHRRTFILPPEKAPDDDEDESEATRLWVKYKPEAKKSFKTDLMKRSKGMKMLYDFDDMNVAVVTVPNVNAKSLKLDSRILSMYEDVERYPQYVEESVKPRDLRELQPSERMPYGIEMVNATQVWDTLGATGAGVTVCVIDTGVDERHDDFSTTLTGVDANSLEWGMDGVGHGTHSAGTVAAVDNEIGVVGVAPDATIFSVKVFADSGMYAFGSGILSAARVCADNGANIISMSLGGPLPNPFELLGWRGLVRQGIIPVAAAGNGGNGFWSFPASYSGVMSVAALDSTGLKAPFSQFNRQVDIAAPGVDVLSTFPLRGLPCLICERAGYGYGELSGTSMACPHVAGVLALLKSIDGEASAQELMDVVEETAYKVSFMNGDFDRRYGHGLVDAIAAAQALVGRRKKE